MNHPLQTLLLLLALSWLAACDREEPTVPAEDPAPTTDETVDGQSAETADGEETNGETDDEIFEVVEESASDEPDEEEETQILLARSDAGDTPANWQFKEGQHYHRLVPSQPTIGGADKIEVAEFFWYGCPHCFDLEPIINAWDADKPANVRFVKVPAMWNDVLEFHAQLFYTEEVLVRNGAIEDASGFRNSVFEEYHRRGNRLLSEQAVVRLFDRYGVDEEAFKKTWGSFEVAQKLRVAKDLARRYSISSVPTIVVNGKFRTSATETGSYPKLIEVIDELVAKESVR